MLSVPLVSSRSWNMCLFSVTKVIYIVFFTMGFLNSCLGLEIDKSIESFYNGCATKENIICSGVYAKDCIHTRTCLYAGSVWDNGTHFDVILMHNIYASDLPQAVLFGAAFVPFNNLGEDQFSCKDMLSIQDFRFYLLVNESAVDRNTYSRGVYKTKVEKRDWSRGTPCEYITGGEESPDSSAEFEDEVVLKRNQVGPNNLGNEVVKRLLSSHDAKTHRLEYYQQLLADPRNTRILDGIMYTNAQEYKDRLRYPDSITITEKYSSINSSPRVQGVFHLCFLGIFIVFKCSI